MPENTELEYCRHNFANSDYYHYLISLFIPAAKRPALWTLGAFKHTLESIPSSVTEPTLGLMRLTWWRDQIDILQKEGLAKGHPVLLALKNYYPGGNKDMLDFINEHEALIENPDIDFVSKIYPQMLQKILGSDFVRYKKLENKLTHILKQHHGSRWEGNPPFLAFRLWLTHLNVG